MNDNSLVKTEVQAVHRDAEKLVISIVNLLKAGSAQNHRKAYLTAQRMLMPLGNLLSDLEELSKEGASK